MTTRIAGDFDYETHGGGYGVQRRTDPRIAAEDLSRAGPDVCSPPAAGRVMIS
jgi:hypothetical protein